MRIIDADKIIFHEIDEIGGEYEPYLGCSKSQIDNLPTVEAVPITEKAFEMFETDYKNRLKADLKAILVELQLEIHELENPYPHDFDDLLPLAQHNAFYDAKSTIEDLVDERINAIKGDQEGA